MLSLYPWNALEFTTRIFSSETYAVSPCFPFAFLRCGARSIDFYLQSCYRVTGTEALYDRSLRSFVDMADGDFEMPVSCGRRLSDVCGVCSDIEPILSSFHLLSTRRFLACCSSKSDTADLTFLINSLMPLVPGNMYRRNWRQNCLLQFPRQPHLTCDTYRETRCLRAYRIMTQQQPWQDALKSK